MKFTHTLERLEETEDSGHIRTKDEVKGHFIYPPREGKNFTFFGKGVVEGIRMIMTSPVQTINGDIFTTFSGSRYKLSAIID